MTRYVIDPLTLVFLSEHRCVLDSRVQLVAPHSIRSLALEITLDRVRVGSHADCDALAQHEWMTGLKMRPLGDRVSRGTAWQIARERGVSVRDAEYLAVTRLQADALVALDHGLVAAARDVVDVADHGAICSHYREERRRS